MSDPANRFMEEHRQIALLLISLLDATDSDDPADLQAKWSECEATLLAHLEFEEKELFPQAEGLNPVAIARLKQEHAQIRRLLSDLGVRADLHTFSRSTALELARLLSDHAAYESRNLYPLVRHVPAPSASPIVGD